MDRSGEVVGDKSCTRSPLAKLWEKLRWPLASSLLTPPVALGVGWDLTCHKQLGIYIGRHCHNQTTSEVPLPATHRQ